MFSCCRLFSTVIPFKPELLIDTGVKALALDASVLVGALCSSAKISTALSRTPFVLFRTSEFLLLSVKPMSRKVASFWSKLLLTLVILIPKIWLGLLD